jgi:hypothetical protein
MKNNNLETTNKRLKTGGRVSGTPNKVTKCIRESIQTILDENFDQIRNDIKELNPKDRIEILIKFAEFVIPKMQRTEIKNETKNLYEISSVSDYILSRNKINELRT